MIEAGLEQILRRLVQQLPLRVVIIKPCPKIGVLRPEILKIRPLIEVYELGDRPDVFTASAVYPP
jgi:hypothetical protein